MRLIQQTVRKAVGFYAIYANARSFKDYFRYASAELRHISGMGGSYPTSPLDIDFGVDLYSPGLYGSSFVSSSSSWFDGSQISPGSTEEHLGELPSIDQLKARGKGQYTCPHGTACQKNWRST